MQNNPGYTITHNSGRTFVQMPLYAPADDVDISICDGFSKHAWLPPEAW